MGSNEKVIQENPSSSARLLHRTAWNGAAIFIFFVIFYTAFFSPVLFSHYLAPGDGAVYSLPNYLGQKSYWDLLIAGGFPLFADPQAMIWYPPAFILSRLPYSWNAFVISAYVMASFFTFGYVYALTASRVAALISGLAFGMSGFMMAHLGHIMIIHAAAWLPLIIWSLEMLRRGPSAFWFVMGTIAVACSFLAGHTQIFVYSFAVSGAYAVYAGFTLQDGRLRFLALASLLLLLGVGLAGIQILPTAELSQLSLRSSYSFAEFLTYSFPPVQLLTLIFPMLFGYNYDPATPYFGEWNSTEIVGFVGRLPLMLAAVGVLARWKHSVVLFWAGVAIIAAVISLGDTTIMARLLFHVPVFNQFRAPARHFFEVSFAIAVLAGLGVAAIQRKEVTGRQLNLLLSGAVLIILGCLLWLLLYSDTVRASAAKHGIPDLSFVPWKNIAVGVPLVFFLLTLAILYAWRRSPSSSIRGSVLVLVLILDIATFGWFYDWHYASPKVGQLARPGHLNELQAVLESQNQRLLSDQGSGGGRDAVPPNLSKLWGLPSAGGFNPLALARVCRMLTMDTNGYVGETWRNAEDRSFDLMAVRYIFTRRVSLNSSSLTKSLDGVSWSNENLALALGRCGRHSPEAVKISLPEPVKATQLDIVSNLACSVELEEGTEVVRINLIDRNSNLYRASIVAGHDTSEWAHDCDDVKPVIRHQRAQIFESFPVARASGPCDGHRYLTTLPLNGMYEIIAIELQWVGVAGAISIEKLSLTDKEGGNSQPVNRKMIDSDRWQYVGDSGSSRIYENRQAFPRAWLVPRVLKLTPEETLKAIKTSLLPDGTVYNPTESALVEEPVSLEANGDHPKGSAEITYSSDSTMEIRTSSSTPAFLVLSDVYYPGWQATVNGQPTRLYQTNFALRGLVVPSGNSEVQLRFRPSSLYFGMAVSATSLFVIGLISITIGLRRLRMHTN